MVGGGKRVQERYSSSRPPSTHTHRERGSERSNHEKRVIERDPRIITTMNYAATTLSIHPTVPSPVLPPTQYHISFPPNPAPFKPFAFYPIIPVPLFVIPLFPIPLFPSHYSPSPFPPLYPPPQTNQDTKTGKGDPQITTTPHTATKKKQSTLSIATVRSDQITTHTTPH